VSWARPVLPKAVTEQLVCTPADSLLGHSAPCSGRERCLRTGCSAPSLPLPVNELWSVLPSPRPGEDGVLDTTPSLPSSSHSQHSGAVWKERDGRPASAVALGGSVLSDGRDTSCG